MALAASGAECASVSAEPVSTGGYCVEAKQIGAPSVETDVVALPAVDVTGHVLAVVAVSQVVSLPSGNAGDSSIQLAARPGTKVLGVETYDADARRMASIADANERQLLFVKITRG